MKKKIDIENEWLSRLQSGDEKAFSFLFDHYHRLLYTLAFRYLKSFEEAEDAVQYTFMKIWEQRSSIDFTKGVRSLLFTILKHYVLNELRHHQIVLGKQENIKMLIEESDDGFAEDLEKQELYACLNQAISLLPPQKREICLLKMEDELSNQEIADKMKITVPTVKSHYTQLLKMLRTGINKFICYILFMYFCL